MSAAQQIQLVYEPSQTTHWKNLFPNKMQLLGSHNLNPGEELIAEIEQVGRSPIKNIHGNEEIVPILKFKNAPPMVLNIDKINTITSLYGEYYDAWKGKSIQIFAKMVREYGGSGQVLGLGIRQAIPDTQEDVEQYAAKLSACKTMPDLQKAFASTPKHLKPRLSKLKDSMKAQLGDQNV